MKWDSESARGRLIDPARERGSDGALLACRDIGWPQDSEAERSCGGFFIADFKGFALGFGAATVWLRCIENRPLLEWVSGGGGT